MEFLKLSEDDISLSSSSKYDDDIAALLAAFKAGQSNTAPFKDDGQARSFGQRAKRLIKAELEQGGWCITVRTVNKHSELGKQGYVTIVSIIDANKDDISDQTKTSEP